MSKRTSKIELDQRSISMVEGQNRGKDMTGEEIEAYMAGYMINEDEGGKKEWD